LTHLVLDNLGARRMSGVHHFLGDLQAALVVDACAGF